MASAPSAMASFALRVLLCAVSPGSARAVETPVEHEERDSNSESSVETSIGCALVASLVPCARRRSTEAIEGDVKDGDIREMVGGTAEAKAWICPCGRRPVDVETLEIP